MEEQTKWCPNCKRNVIPEKKLNVVAFFLLTLLYLPFYVMKKPTQCPFCAGTVVEREA